MTGKGRRSIGFAVLGCASVAWRRMLPALAATPGVEVVAVASRDRGRARRFVERFGGAPVEGYDALETQPGIDAVYIPLPPALRAPWVERALRAGRHVLAEKPLTPYSRSTAALFRLARERSLVLMESFPFLFHDQHRVVRSLIAEGAIGELRHFVGAFTFPPRPEGDIRYRRDLAGGALLDAGVYPMRAALHVIGGGLRLVGAALREDHARGVDVGGCALAVNGDGVTASLIFGMEHDYRARYEVTGSRGSLVLEPAFTVASSHSPVLRLVRQGRRQEITLAADDQVANLISAFLAALEDPRRARPWAARSLEQARFTDRVRQRAVRPAVRRAAERLGGSGGAVDIPWEEP